MHVAGLLIPLKILTLNLWALPDAGIVVPSPLREERVAAFCSVLREQAAREDGWDVVLLQEVWTVGDRRALRDCGYPSVVDLDDPSRVLDSGLLILSRWPLERADRHVFYAAVPPGEGLATGESLARKSSLVARVLAPAGAFWVANTHLVANYSSDGGDDGYLGVRKLQFREFVRHALRAAGEEALIVGGDWNFSPQSPQWPDVATLLPGFRAGVFEGPSCTVCPPNGYVAADEGQLDHLMLGPGFWGAASVRRVLEERVDLGGGFKGEISDHFGFEITLY